MKILVFSTDDFLTPAGGAELAFREIAKRCPDISFDLVCARLRRSSPRASAVSNVTIHRIGIGLPRLDGILLALSGARRAMIMHRVEPYDLVWAILASYGGFAATRFKRMTGVPFLLTLQEGADTDVIERRTMLIRPVFRSIFCAADGLQAISRYLLAWGKRMGFSGTASIVPNGVDYKTFRLARADERDERSTTLISVSRFVPKNGTDDLVSALALLPPHVRLTLCGDGPLRSALVEHVKRLNLTGRVRFLGFVHHGEIPALLKAADIFVRPSISEGLGSAFLEAMAAGLPVIGTPVGGIPDFLTDGETGFFCNPHDPESVASAIRRVMDMEPRERDRICEDAARMVRERFSWDGIAADMRRIFSALCQNK